MLNTREEIERQIVSEMVSEQNEVTVFEPKTAIRGLITAFAGVIREMWNDLYRERRKMYLNTCYGPDLDQYAAERSITRKGATKAGVILTFKGVAGTIIPKGTVAKNPSTGIGYQTISQITLGQKNTDFQIDNSNMLEQSSIADVVQAECLIPGSIGNTQVYSITTKPAIIGVTSVTNSTPAQGGTDMEADPVFRERIRNYISGLNQGTDAAYKAWLSEIDSRIMKVKTVKDDSRYDAVKNIVVNSSGVNFTASELNYFASEVQKMHRAKTKVTCENIAFTLITIKERVKLKAGYSLDTVFSKTADALAGYFDWLKWEFGGEISIDDVFQVCQRVSGIDDVELNSFTINNANPQTASITQVLYSQVSTAATESSITDTGATFNPDTLIGKYVRITSGSGVGQTRQIIGNTATKLDVLGKWDINPPNGSNFAVVELFIQSSRTKIPISANSLPYFFGLEITDTTDPTNPQTKKTERINVNNNNNTL